MYVTYDLRQSAASPNKEELLRGAKDVKLPGEVVNWKVGEFELPSGRLGVGIRISYVDPMLGPAEHVVEIPPNAENVRLHLAKIPAEYRSALKSVA